jgi:hypothetical protein
LAKVAFLSAVSDQQASQWLRGSPKAFHYRYPGHRTLNAAAPVANGSGKGGEPFPVKALLANDTRKRREIVQPCDHAKQDARLCA